VRLALIVVALGAAAYVARAIRWPFADGDLFWQKHLGAYVLAHGALPHALGGETFTAAGAPWTPQEWLLGTLAAVTIAHGTLWMLGAAAGLAVAVAMLLCARRAVAAGASAAAVAVCVALLFVDVEGSFGIRAQVFAWPLFCALAWLLDRRGRAIFWVFPLVALWANVHASALIAVPLVWIDAAASAVTLGLRDAETRARCVLAALVPFATLLTPLGVRLPVYAVSLLGSPIRASIKEWQPLGWHHDFFWYGGMPLLVLASVAIRTSLRERPRDVAWSALLLAMTLSAVRNAPLLGFALVPLSARGIDALLGRFAWWPVDPLRSTGPRRLAAWLTAAAAAAVVVASLRVPAAKGAFAPPVATFARVAALPGEHRVFCYDFAVCSIALDYPSLRVFMDGRADPYPPAVWRDFNLIRSARRGWDARLHDYRVDVVVAGAGDALDRAIARSPDWRALPQADRCCRVYRPAAAR